MLSVFRTSAPSQKFRLLYGGKPADPRDGKQSKFYAEAIDYSDKLVERSLK
jgi:hypothetical protein